MAGVITPSWDCMTRLSHSTVLQTLNSCDENIHGDTYLKKAENVILCFVFGNMLKIHLFQRYTRVHVTPVDVAEKMI